MKFNEFRQNLLSESTTRKDFGNMLTAFTEFASDHLGLESLPNIKIQKTGELGTSFGGYNPSTNDLHIVTKNRHPMDVLRTIAHELVHHKQNCDGRINNVEQEGSTGSDIENEANAQAGVMMRNWAKKNPHYFDYSYIEEETDLLNEGLYNPSNFKAVIMGGGPASGKDYVKNRVLGGQGLTEINFDHAFDMMLNKRGLSRMMPDSESVPRQAAADRAWNIMEKRKQLAIHHRHGLLINGTAHNPQEVAALKRHLDSLGYETKMLFVNTDNETSRRRNLERGLRGDRKVPDGTDDSGNPDPTIPDTRQKKWDRAQQNRTYYRELFGPHYHEVDNSVEMQTASPEQREAQEQQFSSHHKIFRNFLKKPTQTDAASQWVKQTMQDRNMTAYIPPKAFTLKEDETEVKMSKTRKSKKKLAFVRDIEEEGGAGDFATTKLKRRYQKDTPEQPVGKIKAMKPLRFKKKALSQEDTTAPLGYEFGNNGIGPTVGPPNFNQSPSFFYGYSIPGAGTVGGTGGIFESVIKEFDDIGSGLYYGRGQNDKDVSSGLSRSESVNDAIKKLKNKSKKQVNEVSYPNDPHNTGSISKNAGARGPSMFRIKDNSPAIDVNPGGIKSPLPGQNRDFPAHRIRMVPKGSQSRNPISEENKPKNPELWSKAKSLAKKKFSVYPSAYANGWAAKWYKSKGGEWHSVNEDWQKVNRNDNTDGLSQKAVDAYRRENPGSKLQTAVTEKKPSGKRKKRRIAFCRRMKGMKRRLTSAKTARDPDSRINKALRRWNCE